MVHSARPMPRGAANGSSVQLYFVRLFGTAGRPPESFGPPRFFLCGHGSECSKTGPDVDSRGGPNRPPEDDRQSEEVAGLEPHAAHGPEVHNSMSSMSIIRIRFGSGDGEGARGLRGPRGRETRHVARHVHLDTWRATCAHRAPRFPAPHRTVPARRLKSVRLYCAQPIHAPFC